MGLLSRIFAKEVKTKEVVRNIFNISRQNALEASVKYLGIMEDPDKVLELAGLNVSDAYDEIMTDGHLPGVMGSRLAAVNSLEWEIIRDKASSRVHKHVQLQFEEDLMDMPNLIKDIMQMNPWGIAPISVSWMLDESKYWVDKIEGKPGRWFRYDENNQIRFISTKEPQYGEIPPPYRLLVARNNPSYDNPYGEKLLSKSYWPITWKRNGFKWWNVFIEKLAIPWVIAKMPKATDDDDITKLHTMLKEAVQDTAIVVPEGTDIGSYEPKGKSSSSDIFEALNKRMDAEVSKIWLGETLTTEIGDKGSYAAAQTHAGIKDERRDTDVHEIERVINELITWIVKLNFGDVPAPKFKMSEPFTVDKERAEIDAILARDLGVRVNKNYVSAEYGIDKDDFEIVEPNQQKPVNEDKPEFHFSTADEKALDKAFEHLDDEALQKQATQLLAPIIAMIEKSDGYSDALDNLLKTAPKMNLTEAEKQLKRAIFVSETWGRVNV